MYNGVMTSILYTTGSLEEVRRVAEDVLDVPYVVEEADEYESFTLAINVYAPVDIENLTKEFGKRLKRPVRALEELEAA